MQAAKAVTSRPSPFQKDSRIEARPPVQNPAPLTAVRRVGQFARASPQPAQLSTFEAEMLMEWALP